MKTLKQLSIILAIPVVLAGCNGLESDFRTNQARPWMPWFPKAETSTQQEDFHYKDGQIHLTRSQGDQLTRLVRSTDGGATITARIMTHDVASHNRKSPLKDRVECLIKRLRHNGVPLQSIAVVSQDSPTAGAGHTLTVAVDQTKLIPIVCDGWNYNVGRNVWPEGEPDFGCSNAYNLSRMIDNPRDIVEGRELAESDAARADLYTQFYREGKLVPLLKGEKIIGGK